MGKVICTSIAEQVICTKWGCFPPGSPEAESSAKWFSYRDVFVNKQLWQLLNVEFLRVGAPFGSAALTFYTKLLTKAVLTDLVDVQASVADYFDRYTHERLYSSIDYQTPHHTHQLLIQPNALNCPA